MTILLQQSLDFFIFFLNLFLFKVVNFNQRFVFLLNLLNLVFYCQNLLSQQLKVLFILIIDFNARVILRLELLQSHKDIIFFFVDLLNLQLSLLVLLNQLLVGLLVNLHFIIQTLSQLLLRKQLISCSLNLVLESGNLNVILIHYLLQYLNLIIFLWKHDVGRLLTSYELHVFLSELTLFDNQLINYFLQTLRLNGILFILLL